MRIISSFKDYYDPIQSQGQDLNCVYERDPHLFASTESWLELPRTYHLDVRLNTWKNRRYSQSKYFCEPIAIGFCGKVYLGMQLKGDLYGKQFEFGYDPESFDEVVKSAVSERAFEAYCIPDLLSSHARKELQVARKEGLGATTSRNIRRSFEILSQQVQALTPFFERYNCPIFVVTTAVLNPTCVSRIVFFGGKFNLEDVSNDFEICNRKAEGLDQYEFQPFASHGQSLFDRRYETLEARGFYKLFDAYRAFQEVHMYLSGVLGFNNPHVPIPDDKTMRDIKGFDNFSFKKAPSKKRG